MTCRVRQACEHDHAVSGEFQIHILEVVLAGTLHHDFEIIGQVADVGHQIAIVFLEGALPSSLLRNESLVITFSTTVFLLARAS